jgi:tetratricopeptide (TPR) repeat protein
MIDAVVFNASVDPVLDAMFKYGNRMHRTGDFDLGIAVYERLLEHAARSSPRWLAPTYLALGYCLRESGRYADAERQFVLGSAWAARRGDLLVGLRFTIARGNLACLMGNLHEATLLLDDALRDATTSGDVELIVRAAHERGNVAIKRKELALRYFRSALDAADAWAGSGMRAARDARMRVLGDLGWALYCAGLREEARAVCLYVHLFAKERQVHWAAAINLMPLACARGHCTSFHQHRLALTKAPLPARLKAAYLLEVGDGRTVFGEPEEARAAYLALARVAAKHGLADEARRAFAALRGVADDCARRWPSRIDVPPDLADFLERLRRLGEPSHWPLAACRHP